MHTYAFKHSCTDDSHNEPPVTPCSLVRRASSSDYSLFGFAIINTFTPRHALHSQPDTTRYTLASWRSTALADELECSCSILFAVATATAPHRSCSSGASQEAAVASIMDNQNLRPLCTRLHHQYVMLCARRYCTGGALSTPRTCRHGVRGDLQVQPEGLSRPPAHFRGDVGHEFATRHCSHVDAVCAISG